MAKVETCTCTRCELVQLCRDQSRESGKLQGVMSRVKDLEKENTQCKLEQEKLKVRLAILERNNKELNELAAHFKQAYRSKKNYKRKISSVKEDADPAQDAIYIDTAPEVPAVPEVPAAVNVVPEVPACASLCQPVPEVPA